MYICKHIHEYLVKHNSVIVPDLGCFTVVNKPSVNGIPVKTVELDWENNDDDSILTSYIAKKENITKEQAVENVRKFYKQFIIFAYKRDIELEFEKFGKFLMNATNDIVFIPVVNFFEKNLYES